MKGPGTRTETKKYYNSIGLLPTDTATKQEKTDRRCGSSFLGAIAKGQQPALG
jgi:hypothetical protein